MICLLVSANVSFAQRLHTPNYSDSDYITDTLRMNNYTYICDTLKHARITLRNIEDHPGRDEVCYADGTPLEEELATSLHLDAVVMTIGIDTHLQNIVNDAFSQEQAECLGGRLLHLVLNISSSSGEITDVYFNFPASTGYADIPVEVYRSMEVRFKNEICFELTDLGRKLNYCLLSWLQCPKGRAEESASETEEDADGGTTSGNNNSLQTSLGGVVTDRGTASGGGLSTPTIGGLVTP